MAKLNRDEMERVIREGGSVVHEGRVISHVDHLPSKAELAQGDPAAEARTAEELDDQISRLQAQRATLVKADGAKGEEKSDEKPARRSGAQTKPEAAKTAEKANPAGRAARGSAVPAAPTDGENAGAGNAETQENASE